MLEESQELKDQQRKGSLTSQSSVGTESVKKIAWNELTQPMESKIEKTKESTKWSENTAIANIDTEVKDSKGRKLLSNIGKIFICLFCGILFGIALEKGRVFEPETIRGMFIFRKFIMLKMFLAAVGTGQLLLGLMSLLPLTKNWFEEARLAYVGCLTKKGILSVSLGGFLLGFGMEMSGACPGMVLAQVGAWVGHGSAVMTLFGCLVGALVYGFVEPRLSRVLAPSTPYKRQLLDEFIPISYSVLVLVFAVIMGLVVFALEYTIPWHSELTISNRGHRFATLVAWPPSVAGVLIGCLQVCLVLSVRDTIGGSSSYCTITSQILVTKKMESWSPYLTKFKRGLSNWWQVVYVSGAVVGACISAAASSTLGQIRGVGLATSFFGGFIMLFGARMAGGCTSGHGLSGMGLLAVLSFLTVPMMFAGGISLGYSLWALDYLANLIDYYTF